MRAWFLATALVLIGAASAQAQSYNRAQDVAPPTQAISEYMDVCVNGETFHQGGAQHFFTLSGPSRHVHVTTEGLLISEFARPPSGVVSELTPAVEARFASRIEALRAAAASNSRVRLRRMADSHFVREVSINFGARCR